MYRVSLKWFALGVYIILWWPVIVGQMDLFTLCLHRWTFFKLLSYTNVFVDPWIFLLDISIRFDLACDSIWTKLNELRIVIDLILKSKKFPKFRVSLFPSNKHKLWEIILCEMKRSSNFFDKKFFRGKFSNRKENTYNFHANLIQFPRNN